MEICERIDIEYNDQIVLYLPPNHQLLDLTPIEKDDVLALGSLADIHLYQLQYDAEA